MSFNFDPEWTNAAVYPSRAECACPHCHTPPDKEHYKEITECLRGHTPYITRHIPPSLLFTCMNEDCEHCDEDYAIKLRITVEVTK